jgi:hypothetical protein
MPPLPPLSCEERPNFCERDCCPFAYCLDLELVDEWCYTDEWLDLSGQCGLCGPGWPECCGKTPDDYHPFFVSTDAMDYDAGLAYCASKGASLAAIYNEGQLATARAAISAARVEKAIVGAESDGNGWTWHGTTTTWDVSSFPLNTGQVRDQADGLADHVYSLHGAGQDFVWDADMRSEEHRVLCRMGEGAPCDPAADVFACASPCPSGNWIASNSNTENEHFLMVVHTPEQCIKAAQQSEKDCDIANIAIESGPGRECWCQYGVYEAEPDASWASCQLMRPQP